VLIVVLGVYSFGLDVWVLELIVVMISGCYIVVVGVSSTTIPSRPSLIGLLVPQMLVMLIRVVVVHRSILLVNLLYLHQQFL